MRLCLWLSLLSLDVFILWKLCSSQLSALLCPCRVVRCWRRLLRFGLGVRGVCGGAHFYECDISYRVFYTFALCPLIISLNFSLTLLLLFCSAYFLPFFCNVPCPFKLCPVVAGAREQHWSFCFFSEINLPTCLVSANYLICSCLGLSVWTNKQHKGILVFLPCYALNGIEQPTYPKEITSVFLECICQIFVIGIYSFHLKDSFSLLCKDDLFCICSESGQIVSPWYCCDDYVISTPQSVMGRW